MGTMIPRSLETLCVYSERYRQRLRRFRGMESTSDTPVVEIVAFGHNRANLLETFIRDLHSYLSAHLPAVWQLTIADNGSTDESWPIAVELAGSLSNIRADRIEERLGRKELRFRWSRSQALVAAFIEVRALHDFDRTLAPLIRDASRQSPLVEFDRRLTRRQALNAIGTVGLGAFLAACVSNATSTTIAGSSTTSTSASPTTTGAVATTGTAALTAIDCVLVPEMTEGPYYLDLDLVRSDITEDRSGAPLALTIVVASMEGCTPIQDAAVDLWHCDAEGIYSGFVAASTGQGSGTDDSIFLRGTQLTDTNGQATFQTLYPGWYRGRTVHMHMKVHVGGSQIHTTQLFFDDAFTDQVYSSNEPYSSRNNRDVLNGEDGIYLGGGEATTLTVTESDARYAATLVVGVQA
jgi:protocatechuate 3,4-dioxygenase beta subunit